MSNPQLDELTLASQMRVAAARRAMDDLLSCDLTEAVAARPKDVKLQALLVAHEAFNRAINTYVAFANSDLVGKQ